MRYVKTKDGRFYFRFQCSKCGKSGEIDVQFKTSTPFQCPGNCGMFYRLQPPDLIPAVSLSGNKGV